MAASVYEPGKIKAQFKVFKTVENEIKTFKIAAIRFFFCIYFGGLKYHGTPNDIIVLSPFERQAFRKNPDKLYIF